MSQSTSIVAIVSVLDTREYVEDGDRWVPVPGSGDSRSCDRCGRLHEVHATVELGDGSTAVVGTGCMRGEDADLRRSMQAGARAAKKARREHFEAQRRAVLVAEYEAARAEVDALTLPPVTTSLETRGYGKITVLSMDDVDVWHLRETLSPRDREERVRVLTSAWKQNRMRDRGITHAHRVATRTYGD